jgi:para-aminobenzoate synthetase / 4-amino-4-deoxychorismate lyase
MNTRPNPDPARGVFETLLVVDGRPVELEAHLTRLLASAEALYGADAVVDPGEEIIIRAGEVRLGRLRVALAPRENDRLETEIRTTGIEPASLFPGPERAVSAHTLPLAEGLGEHKWVDRSLVDEHEAGLPAGEPALIVDRGDTVLEASRANVFAVRGRVLETPPADGRILPGIARRRIVEAAAAMGLETRECELTIGNLIAAEEVFFAGSVRGVEPVHAIDGVELACPHVIGAQVGAELKRAWLPTQVSAGSG